MNFLQRSYQINFEPIWVQTLRFSRVFDESFFLFSSGEQTLGLVSFPASYQLVIPTLVNVVKVLLAKFNNELFLDYMEFLKFHPHDVNHQVGLVHGHHILKSTPFNYFPVLLDSVELVVPAGHVALEPLAVLLVPAAVVADHQLPSWFQCCQELSEEFFLLWYMKDGVAAVDHVIKVLWVVHGHGILHIELDPVLDSSLHLCPVVICNSDHVGGKINPVHICSIRSCHVES